MKIQRIELHISSAKSMTPTNHRWDGKRPATRSRSKSSLTTAPMDGANWCGSQRLADVAQGVIRMDPEHFGSIWQSIVNTRYQGGGYSGIASKVASAIDIALHDLVGKSRGLPVYELLGGKVRDRYSHTPPVSSTPRET